MFKDETHEKYYIKFLEMDQTSDGDQERKSLFYTLSMMNDTRNHINDLYDFKEHWINIEGLDHGWQTSGTRALTKLAFNLYNGFDGSHLEERCRVTPLDIFTPLSSEYTEYLMNAIYCRLGR